MLLDELCGRLGFILSGEARRDLLASLPTTVDEFTDAVFVADGSDPTYADSSSRRTVRDMVQQRIAHLLRVDR